MNILLVFIVLGTTLLSFFKMVNNTPGAQKSRCPAPVTVNVETPPLKRSLTPRFKGCFNFFITKQRSRNREFRSHVFIDFLGEH